MINLFFTIIRYFILYLCCFYGYIKLANIKFKLLDLIGIPVALLLATGFYFATNYLNILIPLASLSSSIVYLFIRYNKPKLDILTFGTIACGISFFAMIVPLIISLPLNLIIIVFTKDQALVDTILYFVLSMLQMSIFLTIFKSKRFMARFNDKNKIYIDLFLLLSVAGLFILTLLYARNTQLSAMNISILFITFFGLILIVWWRKVITSNYKSLVTEKEAKQNKKALKELKSVNEELTAQNERLSKVIHRDNKLIPAMLLAVKRVIYEGQSESADEIYVQLQSLAEGRADLIEDYKSERDPLPQTGNASIDSVLMLVSAAAKRKGINFKLDCNPEAVALLSAAGKSVTDLDTIIADLCENAVHAVQSAIDPHICVVLEVSDGDIPRLCFYDNGAHFNPEVIKNFGVARFTTRKTEGGSGIGLFTLFEILKKYNASFCLDETPHNNYTKCVKITFDGLGEYSVKSVRKEVTAVLNSRKDFFV